MMPGGIFLPSVLTGAPQPDLRVHAPEEMGDAIGKFRTAIEKGDPDAAQVAWSFAKPEDKHKFGKSPQINRDLQQIARVAGPLTIHVMAEAGLDFTGRTDLIDYMLKIGFPHWFDLLAEVGGTLMASFMAYLPARDALDDKALAKLDRIILDVSNPSMLKPLFERVYVPLSDASYDPTQMKAAPWHVDQIHRLYRVLRAHLPVAHVRAVRSFHIATEKFVDNKWKKVGYAWWTSTGYVALPEKSSNTKEGDKRDHDMTGGSRAHADPSTPKGKEKEKGVMDHFEVSALHEVGHAVGDRLGGHDWASSYPYVDWQTQLTSDAWSKGLWGNDTSLSVRAKHRAKNGQVIASADARQFLANGLLGNKTLPKGWEDEDDDTFLEALDKQYGDQPLVKVYKNWQKQTKKEDWYKFSATDNFGSDGRVYVYLTRNNRGFSSYTQQAFKQKVSWYSMASPHEWFAEQYAHYYRTGKTGEGLETGVAKKLAELDVQTPTEPAQAPASAGPSSDSEGGDSGERRVPFPW